MENSKPRRVPTLSLTTNPSLTYRAEVFRRDLLGRASVYYDGGEYSPYCVDSLVDTLRAEVHAAHEQVDVSIELKGACNSTTVRELARRLGALREPRMHVRISAPGYPGITITADLQGSDRDASGPADTSDQLRTHRS